jgi:hypothetical protein
MTQRKAPESLGEMAGWAFWVIIYQVGSENISY